MSADSDRPFAQVAVLLGLARAEEIDSALAARRTGPLRRALAEVLVERGVLRPDDVRRIEDVLRAAAPAAAAESRPAGGSVAAAATHAAEPPESGLATTDGRTAPPADAGERFEILAELGRGAMGVVYRARQVGLGRMVALKVMASAEHAGADERERFRREAHAAAKLHHPGIVEVYDVGELTGRPYIAMEWVDGVPLDHWLARERPDLRSRTDLVRRVAEAVEHAHQRGIVHRDLKPANILVDAAGQPRVADFGLAKELRSPEIASLTGSGAVLGTPQYMSPEQADGEAHRVDARSDVYSLGAILYEAITGRRTFETDGVVALLMRIANDDPPPPRRHDPAIPLDLETVCLRALERDPQRRYPSAGALADDLARLLAGEPVHARPVTFYRRTWGKLRRHRRFVLPLAASGLVAAGLAAWMAAAEVRRTREVRDALRAGTDSRAAGDAAAARDAWRRASTLDPGNREAAEGLAWAEPEVRRLEEEARAAQAELERSRLVSRVLTRWSSIAESVRGLEELAYAEGDPTTRQPALDRAWEPVAAFLRETPGDAVSQATALAFAGWTRRLAGYPAEGDEWMERAAGLAPQVPYGRLLAALALFSRYVEAQSLPASILGSGGLEFAEVPEESAEQRSLRGRLDALLAEVGATRTWGGEGQDDHRRLAEALRHWQADDFEAAERELTQALALPALRVFDAGLRLVRAKARYRLRRFADGLRDLDEVGRVRAASADVDHLRGVLLGAAGIEAGAAGQDPRPWLLQAVAAATRAVERAPDNVPIRVQRALAQLEWSCAEARRGGDPLAGFARAIEDLEWAVQRQPERGQWRLAHAHARNLRGDHRAATGGSPVEDYRAALAEYDEVGRMYPRHVPMLIGRGRTRCSLAETVGEGRRDLLRQAVEDFDAALAIDPDRAAALAGRGTARRALAEAEESAGLDGRETLQGAIEDLGRAIEQNPRSQDPWPLRAAAWHSLAKALARRGLDAQDAFDRAEADYVEIARRNPGDMEAWVDRGLAQQDHGRWLAWRNEDPVDRYRAALASFDTALAIHTSFANALCARGCTWQALGEWLDAHDQDPEPARERALADFAGAARSNSRMWQAHLYSGQVRRARREFAAAVVDIEQAFELRPDHPSVAEALTQARAEKASVEGLDWAVQLGIGHDRLRYGDVAGARDHFETGLAARERGLEGSSEAERAAALAPDWVGGELQGTHYDLACVYARLAAGRTGADGVAHEVDPARAAADRDRAFANLEAAIGLGWNDANHMEADPDLAELRGDPRWAPLVGRLGR